MDNTQITDSKRLTRCNLQQTADYLAQWFHRKQESGQVQASDSSEQLGRLGQLVLSGFNRLEIRKNDRIFFDRSAICCEPPRPIHFDSSMMSTGWSACLWSSGRDVAIRIVNTDMTRVIDMICCAIICIVNKAPCHQFPIWWAHWLFVSAYDASHESRGFVKFCLI